MRAAPSLDAVTEATRPRDRFKWLGYWHLLNPEADSEPGEQIDVAVGVCERCGVMVHWNSRRYHSDCKERTWRA